jgi:hypothetical protein
MLPETQSSTVLPMAVLEASVGTVISFCNRMTCSGLARIVTEVSSRFDLKQHQKSQKSNSEDQLHRVVIE